MARKMGRPSVATPELQQEILDRMIEGESLRAICRSTGIPSRTTILRWLDEDESFRGQYARAREMQADYLADLIQETALASTPETAHSDRVKIDAFKWTASKLLPKRYGDKIQHTGADGEGPVETTLNITFVRPGQVPRIDAVEGEFRQIEDNSDLI